ncbi:MAG: hypothetical protein ACREOE_02200 [Gemmatimonadales bacterium]
MVDHQIVDRRVGKVPVNLWRGDISCTCGWTHSVESCVDEASAYLGLRSQWVQHGRGAPGRQAPLRSKTRPPGYGVVRRRPA